MDPFQADDAAPPTGCLDIAVRRFLERLADPSPEPAGGAALALATAMAAALVSLVSRTQIARRAVPAEDATARTCREEAERLLAHAEGLVDRDIAAYGAVMGALTMSSDTAEQATRRRVALDAALAGATDVPLDVAETALAVLELADRLALDDRSPLRGDLHAARALAGGAAEGALGTARVNIAALRDPEIVARLESRAGAAGRGLAAVNDAQGHSSE